MPTLTSLLLSQSFPHLCKASALPQGFATVPEVQPDFHNRQAQEQLGTICFIKEEWKNIKFMMNSTAMVTSLQAC